MKINPKTPTREQTMDKRTYKDTIYYHLSQMVKAIANPHRLEILELLAQGRFSVEQIASETNLSVANASQHLQVMKRVQLIESRKEGVTVYYQLSDEKVYQAWKALRDLGMDKIAEIERIMQNFREANQGVEVMSCAELYEKMKNDEARVIDVRPEIEFRHGHIANAESIPVDELKVRVRELSEDREIVVYCRGPFCVYADQAVDLLKNKGYDSKRLDEGFPEWTLKGLPVERSEV